MPQYPFPSLEARREAVAECDRAIAAGHMEYVPSEEADDIIDNYCIHPWTMDLKGGKWRGCQDYSLGTNRAAQSAPFGLPTPWSVKRVMSRDTHFAKYDLRVQVVDQKAAATPTHPRRIALAHRMAKWLHLSGPAHSLRRRLQNLAT